MNEPKIIFTDGINKINVINGMIRLTIGTVVAAEETSPESFKDEYVLVETEKGIQLGVVSEINIDSDKLKLNKELKKVLKKATKKDYDIEFKTGIGEQEIEIEF